ncbi:MAG: hypothetical protein CM1200mP9_10750 [Gammaproteobacteria bacterium]|nr:MAG: hypothetical protein CM1200mP9_10750 [Gammaproteobacteria bacterium]
MLPEFDFGLGETIDMLRRSVRDFCQQEIVPIAERIDQSNEFPRILWPLLGDLGVLGVRRGKIRWAGLGYLAHCVVMEEISRASGLWALFPWAHSNLCSINCVDMERTSKNRSIYRISFPVPPRGTCDE